MALTDEGGSGIPATMLVGPANYAGGGMPYPVYTGNSGGGNGGFGNDGNGWWIILLFIILFAAGGWNNNGNGNGGGFGGGQPIVINDGYNGGGAVQRGFDQAAVMGGINGVQSGVQNLSTQLCNCCSDMQNTVNQGFFGVQNALCNGFNGVEQSANTRQMANMQTAFGLQTAMNQGFNSIGSQFADCCCENRLANCQTQNIIQNEGNTTRFADANNTRDIIQSQTNGTQAILDKLCQLELDGVKAQVEAKNDRIAELTTQLNMANLAASQTAQTAAIRAGQVAEIDAMYNRLRDCPVPTMPVYGMQPIFTCPNNNSGCGCGCNGNGNF